MHEILRETGATATTLNEEAAIAPNALVVRMIRSDKEHASPVAHIQASLAAVHSSQARRAADRGPRPICGIALLFHRDPDALSSPIA